MINYADRAPRSMIRFSADHLLDLIDDQIETTRSNHRHDWGSDHSSALKSLQKI